MVNVIIVPLTNYNVVDYCMEESMVSVVVPVYNSRDYLQESLTSLREQTYSNLEIILVDDASTDASGDICEDFCKRDKRFSVVHHPRNMGASEAQNTGLRLVKGDFVYIMDNDDYIHKRAIEVLVNVLNSTGLDLVAFDYCTTESRDEDTSRPLGDLTPVLLDRDTIIWQLLKGGEEGRQGRGVLWNKLFRRSLLEGLWLTNCGIIDDQDFSLRVYLRVSQMGYVPEKLYYYYLSPDSISRDAGKIVERQRQTIPYRFRMCDYLSKEEPEKKYRAWVLDRAFRFLLQYRDIASKADVKEIIRVYLPEFIKSPHIPLRRKGHVIFYWFFPHLSGFYAKYLYKRISRS